MMNPIELTITSSVQDRVDVAAILIKNGYRVCQKTVKVAGRRCAYKCREN